MAERQLFWGDFKMADEDIRMVQECVSLYAVHEQEDGSINITIEIPKIFSNLWLVRLSELRTTKDEIESHKSTESTSS